MAFWFSDNLGNEKSENQSRASNTRESGASGEKPLLGRKVLVVDDSSDNQFLFTRFLRSAGAQVDTAGDGIECLQTYLDSEQAGRSYDGVVMDIRMPKMDGYEATRRLRAAGYAGPIVALTAHAVPGEEERCLRAGCSEFLTKPIDRTHFNETLSRCMRTSDRRLK